MWGQANKICMYVCMHYNKFLINNLFVRKRYIFILISLSESFLKLHGSLWEEGFTPV